MCDGLRIGLIGRSLYGALRSVIKREVRKVSGRYCDSRGVLVVLEEIRSERSC